LFGDPRPDPADGPRGELLLDQPPRMGRERGVIKHELFNAVLV
jgi:hypothetical protein